VAEPSPPQGFEMGKAVGAAREQFAGGGVRKDTDAARKQPVPAAFQMLQHRADCRGGKQAVGIRQPNPLAARKTGRIVNQGALVGSEPGGGGDLADSHIRVAARHRPQVFAVPSGCRDSPPESRRRRRRVLVTPIPQSDSQPLQKAVADKRSPRFLQDSPNG